LFVFRVEPHYNKTQNWNTQIYVSYLCPVWLLKEKRKNKSSSVCAASEEFRLVPEDITPVKEAECNNTHHPKK